ncbi:MAG: hypothetical protein KA980_13665, partial [Flavobacterium sp.]
MEINNSQKMNFILENFDLSKEAKKLLLEIALTPEHFRSFSQQYSKLHKNTKQLKKEFLISVAYSSSNNIYNLKQYDNHQYLKKKVKNQEDADSISSAENYMGVGEKIFEMAGFESLDGSTTFKNLMFNIAKYSNIKNVQDLINTMQSSGHVELNSIINASEKNERLFFSYIKELHNGENSFVHNYFAKHQHLENNNIKEKKDDLVRELKIAQKLYGRLSDSNREIAFFCNTNDLINSLNKSIYRLKLNRENLLNEKDPQFSPDTFKFFQNRFGIEIMKKFIDSELDKMNGNLGKSFKEKVLHNYQEHIQVLHNFYFSQTTKNINKDLKRISKLNIDYAGIKETFKHANLHLQTLKELAASDISFSNDNLEKILQIEKNIKILSKNLNLYENEKGKYKDTSTLVNMLLSGKIEFSLPYALQNYELKDLNNKKMITKENYGEQIGVKFFEVFNETSKLYQELIIANNSLKEKRQVEVALLSKSNFEF